MNCTNCGIMLNDESKFCPECGTKVEASVQHGSNNEAPHSNSADLSPNTYQAEASSIPNTTGETEEEMLRRFVGKKSNYYLKRWSSASNPSKKSGWNWAAFFLTVFWLG